jgi:hypothetical protein
MCKQYRCCLCMKSGNCFRFTRLCHHVDSLQNIYKSNKHSSQLPVQHAQKRWLVWVELHRCHLASM